MTPNAGRKARRLLSTQGRYFKTAEAKRHTLGDLVDRYIAEVLPTKPKNASNSKQHLLWWQTKLGSYALADVTPALIVKCRNDLLATTTRRGTKMAVLTYLPALTGHLRFLPIAVKYSD